MGPSTDSSAASSPARSPTTSPPLHAGTFSYYDDEPLPPISLHGYMPTTKNRLLTPEMCDEIRNLMPTRVQLYTDWHLLYSLEQFGASLHSLYANVMPSSKLTRRVGYVLVIKDRKGSIFGAYANEPFHPTDSRRYYGNGECFLWKMEKVPNVILGDQSSTHEKTRHKWRFKGYPYTGLNEFVIYCTSEFLSMGAGDGHYGLWCDDGLVNGVCDPSLTFGNEVLSREGNKFHIVGLEVWRVG